MYDKVVTLIGSVPSGFEPIVYIFACIVSLFLLNSFVSFFFYLFGGHR